MSRPLCTAFLSHEQIVTGARLDVALKLRALAADPSVSMPLVLDNATGKVIDLDLSGSEADVARRYMPEHPSDDPPRGPGRPKLGVVAREITLLPRHWDWLAAQPGGASVALRKLVEAARRENAGADQQARDRAYQAMSVLAGDLPGFEEASRALFAGDRTRFEAKIASWPRDIGSFLIALLTARNEP